MKYRGRNFTNPQLVEMACAIEADPRNQAPPGALMRFTPKARKQLDEIAQAITDNLIDKQKAEGTYQFAGGYSGRQTNRR
jgi:hypothetical protein